MRELCRCSHDRSTHHAGKYNCLSAYCDCKEYQPVYGVAPTEPAPALEPVPLPNIDEDVAYLLRNLYRALRIPADYLNAPKLTNEQREALLCDEDFFIPTKEPAKA